jgi:uncharacterized protein (DUF4415 family)
MRKNYDFSKAKRGAVAKVPKGKTRITIRIDDEVLDWFRNQVDEAGGGNYQSLINDSLKQFIASRQEQIESVIRRVVREELKRVGDPKNKRAA